ncbi:MAG: hypothetical protein KJO54_03670, partial [Gammaproteobacteria bacterium]|nr:hypothetical protein [Gammaproteobacteria bacterium]
HQCQVGKQIFHNGTLAGSQTSLPGKMQKRGRFAAQERYVKQRWCFAAQTANGFTPRCSLCSVNFGRNRWHQHRM